MRIGDLVELSSKGTRILWCRKFRRARGIVTEVELARKKLHNIQVIWVGKGNGWIHRTYLKVVSRG